MAEGGDGEEEIQFLRTVSPPRFCEGAGGVEGAGADLLLLGSANTNKISEFDGFPSLELLAGIRL